MNLLEAEDLAKSLPIAGLKKYADGFDPNTIPPWLATGVMDAKAKRMEMASNIEGGAQGQQPTIKEQIDQKAGLLALQQAQQRNQQQQMMQPRPSMATPDGTPQPRPQPQASEETFFAARGGLARLPANFKFDNGGIVAFATGNEVKAGPEFIKFLRSMGIDYTDFVKSSADAQNNIKDMFKAAQGSQPTAAAPAAQAVQGNASPKAFAAGQAMRPGIAATKSAVVPRLGGAAGAGAAGIVGLMDVNDAKEFYDDPNVPTSTKIKQFSRTAANTALPTVGGIVGSGIAPVAGTLGGTALGAGAAALYNKFLDQFGGDELAAYKATQAAKQKDNQSAAETARLNATTPAVAMGNEGRRTGPVAAGNGINVSPNLIPASVRPPAEKPQGKVPQNVNPNVVNVPAAPAAPAAPAPDSMDAMFRDMLKNKPSQRKVEDLIAEDQDIKKRLGLDEPAGKAKLDRIAEIKQQYAATQMSPMDELIAMLGKSGQYKGLSGLAPAYTSMAEKKRAADLAHAERINELMGGVEDTQRAEKTASATGVKSAREKDIGDVRAFDRDALTAAGTGRGQDIQAASSKYNADMHYKAAMAQMANANARQDAQEKRTLMEAFKTRISSIDKELAPLLKAPFGPAKAQIAELQAEKAGITKALDEASGISKITGAPGAGSPGGTTRMRFDAQGNMIK